MPQAIALQKYLNKIVSAMAWCVLLLSAFPGVGRAQWNLLNPVTEFKKDSGGLTFSMNTGILRLQVESDSIVRVTYTLTATPPETRQFMVTKQSWPAVEWSLQSNDKDISLSTARLKVTVARKDGSILFSDSIGNKLF